MLFRVKIWQPWLVGSKCWGDVPCNCSMCLDVIHAHFDVPLMCLCYLCSLCRSGGPRPLGGSLARRRCRLSTSLCGNANAPKFYLINSAEKHFIGSRRGALAARARRERGEGRGPPRRRLAPLVSMCGRGAILHQGEKGKTDRRSSAAQRETEGAKRAFDEEGGKKEARAEWG